MAGDFSSEGLLDDIHPLEESPAHALDRSGDRSSAGGRRRTQESFDEPSPRREAEDDAFDADPEGAVESDSFRSGEGPSGTEASQDGDGEPRKRRRRGRRGGRRRRGRGDGVGREETSEGVAAGGSDSRADSDHRPNPDLRPAPSRRGEGDGEPADDDEPLRSGYMGDVARNGGESPRRGAGESGGDRGQRRRRGRSGRGRRGEAVGEADARPSPGDAGRGGSEARADGMSRGGRRGGSGGRGSRSDRAGRGRGGDFKPVGGSLHEDDEGLELLSVDEGGGPERKRAASDEGDDVFVESGLADVLDVPSWVEAIGIVIAGNLEARSRPQRPENRGR